MAPLRHIQEQADRMVDSFWPQVLEDAKFNLQHVTPRFKVSPEAAHAIALALAL